MAPSPSLTSDRAALRIPQSREADAFYATINQCLLHLSAIKDIHHGFEEEVSQLKSKATKQLLTAPRSGSHNIV
jgi:hypothetical protein